MYAYNITSEKWVNIPPLNEKKADFSLVVLNKTLLYAVGGRNEDGNLRSIEVMDMSAYHPKWELKEN